MKRSYVHLNEAWYKDTVKAHSNLVDDVILEVKADNIWYGEIVIEWVALDNKAPCPQLKSFDDSWKALAACSDLIAELAKLHDTCPQPAAVIDILKRLGFEDETNKEK